MSEIAEVLDIAPNAAKRAIFRAVQKLLAGPGAATGNTPEASGRRGTDRAVFTARVQPKPIPTCARAGSARQPVCRIQAKCLMRFRRWRQFRSERRGEYRKHVWETLRPQLIPYQKKRLPPGGAWTPWRVHSAGGQLRDAAGGSIPQAAVNGNRVRRDWRPDVPGGFAITAAHCGPGGAGGSTWICTERLPGAAWSIPIRTVRREKRAVAVGSTGTAGVEPALSDGDREQCQRSRRWPGLLEPTLEGVLAEIANDPNLTAEDLERVRSEMNTQGILFEIRVLRSPAVLIRAADPNPQDGASI